MILAFLFLMTKTPQEIRLESWDPPKVATTAATVTIDGIDSSDESVRISARHFCGETQECYYNMRGYRESILSQYESSPKKVVETIRKFSDNSVVNWQFAAQSYFAPRDAAQSAGVALRASRRSDPFTCNTYSSANGSYYSSTCGGGGLPTSRTVCQISSGRNQPYRSSCTTY
jgi:hypothetical protein